MSAGIADICIKGQVCPKRRGALGFDAAAERGQRYAAHGADAVMVKGLDSPDEILLILD